MVRLTLASQAWDVFARRTRVRARRRTCQYVEHPGRVQRGENSQIRVRSRESVKYCGWGVCSGVLFCAPLRRPTPTRRPASDGCFPLRRNASSSMGFATDPTTQWTRGRWSNVSKANSGPGRRVMLRRLRRDSTGSSFAATATGCRGSTVSRRPREQRPPPGSASMRITLPEGTCASGCRTANPARSWNRVSSSTRAVGRAGPTSFARTMSPRACTSSARSIPVAETSKGTPPLRSKRRERSRSAHD